MKVKEMEDEQKLMKEIERLAELQEKKRRDEWARRDERI